MNTKGEQGYPFEIIYLAALSELAEKGSVSFRVLSDKLQFKVSEISEVLCCVMKRKFAHDVDGVMKRAVSVKLIRDEMEKYGVQQMKISEKRLKCMLAHLDSDALDALKFASDRRYFSVAEFMTEAEGHSADEIEDIFGGLSIRDYMNEVIEIPNGRLSPLERKGLIRAIEDEIFCLVDREEFNSALADLTENGPDEVADPFVFYSYDDETCDEDELDHMYSVFKFGGEMYEHDNYERYDDAAAVFDTENYIVYVSDEDGMDRKFERLAVLPYTEQDPPKRIYYCVMQPVEDCMGLPAWTAAVFKLVIDEEDGYCALEKEEDPDRAEEVLIEYYNSVE